MKPDNIISRLVRPGLLIWLTAILSFMAITDGNLYSLTFKEVYVLQISALLMVGFGAYFAGKSYEHATRINKKDKEDA